MAPLHFIAAYAIVHVLAALACGLWAYGDAKQRACWGFLWFLIVFCFFPLGLVVWLLGRPKLRPIRPSGDPDETLKSRANRGVL